MIRKAKFFVRFFRSFLFSIFTFPFIKHSYALLGKGHWQISCAAAT
jgi:hypothetical protein